MWPYKILHVFKMADQEARETFSSSNDSKKRTAGELSLLKSKTKRSKFVNMESEKSKENDSEGHGIDNSNLSEQERCERGKHKAIKG